MTMGFCMVRKTSISTPRTLSFSLVFFPSVTAQSETRPDLEAYAIPPTPLEAAPDFPWIIRFSEYYSPRFQREVRQLNSLSEFLQRFEEIQVYQLRCKGSWSAFEPVLDGFGAILEPSWAILDLKTDLGAIWEPFWSHPGPS